METLMAAVESMTPSHGSPAVAVALGAMALCGTIISAFFGYLAHSTSKKAKKQAEQTQVHNSLDHGRVRQEVAGVKESLQANHAAILEVSDEVRAVKADVRDVKADVRELKQEHDATEADIVDLSERLDIHEKSTAIDHYR